MSLLPYPRLTPWVLRLLVINAVVLLLMETLFTSPELRQALAFVPDAALGRPWTFVSYMFVHGGFGHLLFNSIALFVFGAAVESRMGSRQFILYYLYCGVGAAIFSLLLLNFLHVSSSFYGASGAILGVMVAFAVFWPDAEMLVFPIPVPAQGPDARNRPARDRRGLLALAGQRRHCPSGASGRGGGRLALPAPPGPLAPGTGRAGPLGRAGGHAPVGRRRGAGAPGGPDSAPRRPRPATDSTGAELDRVLDKISATGIASLTPAERRFLDEVSRRKQRGVH